MSHQTCFPKISGDKFEPKLDNGFCELESKIACLTRLVIISLENHLYEDARIKFINFKEAQYINFIPFLT